MPRLLLGQWARVKPNCGWIGEPKGHVKAAYAGNRYAEQYLIEFQRPARDADGDGPYPAASLYRKDLRKIAYLG